jgi:hypothetical protein
VTAVFEITVFNTATQTAADYSIEAETETRAVASLARELESRPTCTITFEHTSYFCGHPGCPAALGGKRPPRHRAPDHQ